MRLARVLGSVLGLVLALQSGGRTQQVAPAVTLGEDGFVLDQALPTTIAEGRRYLEKWPEAVRICLPGGQVLQPGDRFVNKDYANTLRTIQRGGADAFYRGELAKQIAADMDASGGIITLADLAQYRAMEREPIFQKIGRKGEVRYGYAAAFAVDVAKGLVEGGAEPRRSHAAVAAARR
jgi:gamma-glutamyltranspeptidase/glutathione hydrolase